MDQFKTSTTISSNLKSKIFAAIGDIRKKKRRPDVDAIYKRIMKSEISNTDKNLIETIIAEIAKQNVIIN